MSRKTAKTLPAVSAGAIVADFADAERRTSAVAWLNDAIRRAEDGDAEALKTTLAVYAEMPSLWRHNEDVMRDGLEAMLLDRLTGQDRLLTRKAAERDLARMRTDLLGEMPAALERVLVNRIVIDWLASLEADADRAGWKGGTIADGEYRERRTDRAHARLMRSLRTLATVRRLAVPGVQINVAEQIQQVNVGAGDDRQGRR